MRKHSEEFKNKINLIGRELDSKLTFGETELGNEQLNAVTPVLQSSLLKSVMKELDIDSNIDIPVGTIVNYKFGVLLDSGDYEYLDYGNYQIYSSEKQEDNNAYNIVAYDKMLNSMVEYTKLKKENVKFPISIRDYITYLCEDIGLEFKNKEDEFANYNRMIESDLYAGLGYTYRDIFDELAQVTASNIIINENDEVEIKYITSTGEIETTSSNNNNIIEVDNIPKQNARSLIVYGNSFQETGNLKNLFNYRDTNYVEEGYTINSNGWITIKKFNPILEYYDFSTHDLNIKQDTDYLIVLEVKSVSGTGRIYNINAQFDTEVYYDFSELKEGDVKVNLIHSNKDYKPGDLDHQYGLRTHTDFNEEQDGELIFRLSVLEDTSITPEQFMYEPYGAMPSPEFPSEIKCVQGNLQLVDIGKNIFNDKQATVVLSSGADASTLPTGVKLTANKTNLEISCIAYKLDDLTNFVGKTVRMKANFSYTKNIDPRYNLGLCDATGNIRQSIVYSDNSGETISLVVPDDLGETKYLCVWLYLNFNRDREYDIGDTCEFNELIVTIDNEDMTYEPYQKTETYIDIGNNKLNSINDVADEHDLISGKGIKRIGECVLTGDESIIFEKDGYIRARIKIDNSSKEGSRKPIISNYFKYALAVNDEGTGFMASGCFYFYLPKEYTTKAQYKQWLKDRYNEGNPVIFKWILETPQEFTTEPVNIQLRKGYNKIEINDKNELINKLDLTYRLEDDTIDEEYLKDVNVKFGEKYGPINSIVLSRSAGADNIYLQDEQSVADNGLCELKISDNQIMNFNDRSDYLPDILNKLNGLEYYINDFSSTGICYYEIADRYNVSIGENTYQCIIFNDEINITQGLEETIYTELPEQAETDYTKADKTDRKINQTYIIVDKQNQTIESVVSQTDTFNERITKTEQDVEGIRQLVEGVYDYTRETSGNNKLTVEQAQEGNLLELHITGEVELLYPQDDLYPEDTLYPLDSYLIVENDKEEKRKFHLPNNDSYLYLYTYNDISDEFVIENIYNENSKQYERKAKIIRRVKVEDDGTRSRLIEPVEEDYGIVNITLFKGKNTIYLESFEGLNYFVKYAIINEIVDEYATKIELSTEITQTEEQIQSVASLKVDNSIFESYRTQTAKLIEDKVSNADFTTYRTQTDTELSNKVQKGNVVSEVNQSADLVSIKANRFELQSTNTQITKEGSFTTKNGTFTNCTIDGGSLKLSNGATVVGDNGLATNLIYPGYVRGRYTTGGGDFVPLGHVGGGDDANSQRNAMMFTFRLPDNFTIKSAKILLLHAPISWVNFESNPITGYSRNLKLYKLSSFNLTYNQGTGGIYSNSVGTEIPNAFGANGFTGSSSTATYATSIDITSQISKTGLNQLFIRTSDGMQTSNATIFGRTGGVTGYLEIIGFMNF